MQVPTDNHIRRLMIHTFAHAAVDFACFYILFARVVPRAQSGQAVAIAFLVYNLIAFGLQPLFGFVIDYFRSFPAASVGCLLVLVGVCLPKNAAYVALAFAALGNAWFHVGAGSDTLLASHGRMWDSGMFWRRERHCAVCSMEARLRAASSTGRPASERLRWFVSSRVLQDACCLR